MGSFQSMQKLDLNALISEAYNTALSKGWYEKGDKDPFEVVVNFQGEISEAWEDWRDHKMDLTFDEKGKPIGFPTEVADILVRIFDIMGRKNHRIEDDLEVDVVQVFEEEYKEATVPYIFYDLHQAAGECLHFPNGMDPEYNFPQMETLIIYTLALCKKFNIDIVYALDVKMRYNKSRPYRHGNKAA